MELYKESPVMFFADAPSWSSWLNIHHDDQRGIWMKFAKKASGITSITYDEALDEALCYGWIDGQAQSYDETYYLQRFTPRRARSMWSKRNVDKVAALTKAGRMQPSGIAQVAAAQQDGRWDEAYASSSTIVVPPAFQTLLDAHPKAKATFETLNKTNRYTILWQVHTAKRPETKQARMQKYLAMLADGITKY